MFFSDENSVVQADVSAPGEKKRVLCQTFRHFYHESNQCLVTSRKGSSLARRLCRHGERFDWETDIGRKSLKEFNKASGKSPPIGGSFLEKDSVTENTGKDVTRAGAMICQLIVNAKLPFATADNMTVEFKIMFSFSKIASSKAPSLFYSTLMVTLYRLNSLFLSQPLLHLSSFSQSCGDPCE